MSKLNATENSIIEDRNIVNETVPETVNVEESSPAIAQEHQSEAPLVEAKQEAPVVEFEEKAPDAEVTEEAPAVEAEEEAPIGETTTSKPNVLDSTKEALGSAYDKIKVAAVASEEKIKGWFGKPAENKNPEDKE